MSGNSHPSFGNKQRDLHSIRNRMRQEQVVAAQQAAEAQAQQPQGPGRRAPLGIVAMVGALGSVAVSCGSPVMEARQQDTDPRYQNGSAAVEFSRELQQRYLELATRAYDRGDFASSDFYAVRSMMAGEGQLAEPRLIDGRGLSPEALADARAVRQRITNAIQLGARESRPVATAQAQAAFDCWMNEAMRAGDVALRDQCRAEATQIVAALESGNKDYAYRAPGQGTMADGTPTSITPTAPMLASSASGIETAAISHRAPPTNSGMVIGADGTVVSMPQTMSHETIGMVPSQRVIGGGVDYAALGYTYVGHIGPDGRLVPPKGNARMTVTAPRTKSAQSSKRMLDTGAIKTAATKITPEMLANAARPRDGDFVVFFPLGSDKITLEAEDTLIDLVDQVQQKNAKRVRLIGHADRSGSTKLNQLLSMRRAQAVRQYLMRAIGRDIDIEIDAVGENAPVLQTDDGIEQALNRRVEIDII